MSYDGLAWVERNYGCVAEYSRCMEEEAEHEAELQHKFAEYCKANKLKLSEAGVKVVWDENCYGCKYYEDIGPTYIDSWGFQDDHTHGICRHKELQNPTDCKGREEGEYNGLDTM